MLPTVTVGLDGSPESLAAAEWAAGEAESLGLPLTLVHAWDPAVQPLAEDTAEVSRLRLRHPGVEVNGLLVPGAPVDVLCRAGRGAELVVLGSRGLGGSAGFTPGSVGLGVVALAERPVVFVRAGRQEARRQRQVVLGLDTAHPDSTLIDFAFDAAARRAAPLCVLHAWTPSPYGPPDDPAEALADLVRPWRRKFPAVEVTEESRYGSAAAHLVGAARDASLVVVGRLGGRSPFGTHVGHVTHAVLHHSPAPVAVVSHG